MLTMDVFANSEVRLSDRAIIFSPQDPDLMRYINGSVDWFARQAKSLGLMQAEIERPGGGRRLVIPAAMAGELPESLPEMPQRDPLDVLGYDYAQLMEMMLQYRNDGYIVIVTSNITNICHHTNDKLLPERGIYSPHQWTGYNYLVSWRASREESKYEPQRINPQLDRLKEILARDGYVKGYEYTLYRPNDDKCVYSTDYYLCRNYLGDEVRVGISHPLAYDILEKSPVAV